MKPISVIGAGAWGTALAEITASNDTPVTLWARNPDLAAQINTAHENKDYLAGIPLNKSINATSELQIALKSDLILMVTPTQSLRSILTQIKPYIHSEHKLVLCCKGIERNSGHLPADIMDEILPNNHSGVLSGPNFAHEIATKKPAATTLACTDESIAQEIQERLTRPTFRPYISNDIVGAQLAGALKNVIAIACGIAHGMELGDSTRASLVTRGLAEIARLGAKMGAHYETFLGLSGVGDMMLTCSSLSSRNFSLGYALGHGENLESILSSRKTVAEGVHTAESAIILAKKYRAEMPISMAVHNCLHGSLSLEELITEMLNRPVGHEL